MSPPPLLEVCVASSDDAAAAQAGGADRVELNSALELGGLTPSMASLIATRQAVCIPIIAMIRPRGGGFDYNDSELAVMLDDAELAVERGADGIAFGILTEDRQVDVPRCRMLLQHIGNRQAVFHRAFDVTADPAAALDRLIDLGVRRVMTSGQHRTALQGAENIARLVHRAAGRIELIPAAGINAGAVRELLARTGCDQVHGSFRRGTRDESVQRGSGLDVFAGRPPVTDEAAVAEVRRLLDVRSAGP